MMVTEAMLPMILVPVTFLFVLLIILIAKAPKVGAWIVGGLVLLAPLFFWRFAATGALRQEEAIPLFVLPLTFLFVLLMILVAKSPRAGVGLIIALAVMVVFGLFVGTAVTHRRVEHVSEVTYGEPPAAAVVEQQAWDGAGDAAARQEFSRVFEDHMQPPAVVPPASPILPALSPIWSEGLEQEFDADVYPSKLAAARALGLQMAAPITKTAGDPNTPFEVVLFQEGNGRDLVAEFARSLEKKIPNLKYSTEADLRNIRPGEVGVTFRLDVTRETVKLDARNDSVSSSVKIVSPALTDSGSIVATAFTESSRASGETRFVEKPWVENFAAFANSRPGEHYIIVRSNGTCTSESEAHQQALDDARARLTEALGRQNQRDFAGLPLPTITTQDVLQGNFIVDRFAQSFSGSAGRIWRQALLIDVSGPKLAQLANAKTHESRQMRESWARMGFSVIGVLVLIGVIYFFLNMATMGYYEWSLRIAGIVLAMIAVFSVLMIVR
jgi:hypothetical protein